jgi:hypothetical protein
MSAQAQPPSSQTPAPPTGASAPREVIIIAVATFFGLLLLGLISVLDTSFHKWVHEHHVGRLPVGIVWFGALGGSMASLTGIFWHHKTNWSDSFNLWHELRPWTGLVMGSIGAFLLLVSTELATSASASTSTRTGFNPDVYYAAAFIAGFAEAPFRAVIKRITDTIFGPGESQPNTDNNENH